MRFRWLLLVVLVACGSDSTKTEATAAPETSTCDRITQFADAITDVGITYDFEPSASPATLASRSEVVYAGRLTGGFAHRDAGEDEPVTSWVAFETEVEDVVHGDVAPGDRVLIAVPYNPAHRPAEAYEDTIAIGAPVMVFGDQPGDAPADLFVGVEGMATGCDGEPPIGRVGEGPGWSDIGTMTALISSAKAPTDRVEVSLWHCGIETITVNDRRWEVPNDEEPFDGTNAPESFAGTGTIEQAGPDVLRYTDDSGIQLRFVPDDGTDPPCA